MKTIKTKSPTIASKPAPETPVASLSPAAPARKRNGKATATAASVLPAEISQAAPAPAATVAATEAKPVPAAPRAALQSAPPCEITSDLIAARAYDIWEQQGRPAGREKANWLLAESQLKEERLVSRA
jgi:hypothetical protein